MSPNQDNRSLSEEDKGMSTARVDNLSNEILETVKSFIKDGMDPDIITNVLEKQEFLSRPVASSRNVKKIDCSKEGEKDSEDIKSGGAKVEIERKDVERAE